jgi:hypothetical protein
MLTISVNILFVEGLKHAQSVYVYVMIEHNKCRPVTFSSRNNADLFAQTIKEAGIWPENITETTPEAFAALIRQKAEMLRTWKADVQKVIN